MKNITAFLVCLSFLMASAVAEENVSPGAKVAVQYMEAFFRGDADCAAQFLGPAVLDPFKASAISRIESIGSPDRDEFLSALGYRSVDAFREAPARELFVKLMKFERANTPTALTERAKAVVVTINSVSAIGGGKQRIILRVVVPNAPSNTASVVVQNDDGKWLVVGL